MGSKAIRKRKKAQAALRMQEKPNSSLQTKKADERYQAAFYANQEELKWIYMELYKNEYQFNELCKNIDRMNDIRKPELLHRDREQNPNWFLQKELLGMRLYAERFAGSVQGVRSRLNYLETCGVNFLHLLQDDAAAASDFPMEGEDQKNMEDLAGLAKDCRERALFLCTDFPMPDIQNPEDFNRAAIRFFQFANAGLDALCIHNMTGLWSGSEGGSGQPEVHAVLRMLRILTEIFCPGMLLLGDVKGQPHKAVSYFGTLSKPECHLLSHGSHMASVWNSVATRDARLLEKQSELIGSLPKQCVFMNYLCCQDEISWDLDYGTLKSWGMERTPHQEYLNQFFMGRNPERFSGGELCKIEGDMGEYGFCTTTASMCGMERAVAARDENAMEQALHLDVMLHAYLLTQSGIPVLYSGDEAGQVNDLADQQEPGTMQQRLAEQLNNLKNIREKEPVFQVSAEVRTLETWEASVLCLVREYQGEKLVGLFNFQEEDRMAWINEQDGLYTDLLTGEERAASGVMVPGHGFYWMKRKQ